MVFSNNNNNPCVQPQNHGDELIRGLQEFRGSFDSSSVKAMLNGYLQRISSPGGSDGCSSRHFHTSEDETLSLRKDSCKDIQTPAETFINRKTRESHFTRPTIPSIQEMKEGKSKSLDASMDKKSSSSMVKTEKKGRFITEEAKQRNRKNPPYIYLMNMIIGFILLVAVIGNIISVLLSVKT